MNTANQKIIDAIIKKAEKVCPDSLALIGVYGSVQPEMNMKNQI